MWKPASVACGGKQGGQLFSAGLKKRVTWKPAVATKCKEKSGERIQKKLAGGDREGKNTRKEEIPSSG